MSKGIVSGVISVVTIAGGAAVTVASYDRLADEGAFGRRGLAGGHLDFTVAALLLVGVALLIAGVIIAFAALAQFLFDRQDARDAALIERSRRREQLTASLPPAVADTHPHRRRIAH